MKKNNTYTHFSAVLHFCSLAIAICVMAFTMNSCQEEDFGFTKEEIHQVAVERDYNKEFRKQFPEVDPHHTWMYQPVQRFITDNGSPATRAITEPKIISEYAAVKDSALRIDAETVDAILKTKMVEAENNIDQITSSFEYLAVTETTYDIWPVLWGEKFCMDNYIGIYVVENGKFKDIGTLWSDTYENVLMGYEDYTENIKNSTRPVNRDITKGWEDNTLPTINYPKQGTTCGTCHGEKEVKCSGTVSYSWGKIKCNKCDKTYTQSEYNNLGNQHKCTNILPCDVCDGSGMQIVKVNPQYYLFPHYKVTMPAGTLWGVYLRTHKDQDNQNDGLGYKDGMVTWCSNPQYSFATGQYPFEQDVKSTIAAGTFTFGGVTYCCFEDAPLSKSNNRGQIFRSYDHDYNDFMLKITPRPVESTYNSSSVRVMCEDLGGSFDWDFNDIVYDLKFEQGAHQNEHATITITLQAVGGTLPIHMIVKGQDMGELHELLGGQTIGADGLFTPINVGEGQTGKDPIELTKIDLGRDKMPDGYDFRQIVHEISLQVCEEHYSTSGTRAGETSSSSSTTTEVSHIINFPDAEGDKAPQCFMTSVGTEWPDELQNIGKKYSEFNDWVKNQASNNDWSKTQF